MGIVGMKKVKEMKTAEWLGITMSETSMNVTKNVKHLPGTVLHLLTRNRLLGTMAKSWKTVNCTVEALILMEIHLSPPLKLPFWPVLLAILF
jgi:hypothetical protein